MADARIWADSCACRSAWPRQRSRDWPRSCPWAVGRWAALLLGACLLAERVLRWCPGLLHACIMSCMGYERIVADPTRMGGLPSIRDTRVTVAAVLGQLAAGRSIDQIVSDYPYLDREDVLAALEFAAAAVQERELPMASAA